MAFLRRWYWRYVRGYRYEICHDCGRPVRVVWTAPDALWILVMGSAAGILCPTCFDERVLGMPFALRWIPRVEEIF